MSQLSSCDNPIMFLPKAHLWADKGWVWSRREGKEEEHSKEMGNNGNTENEKKWVGFEKKKIKRIEREAEQNQVWVPDIAASFSCEPSTDEKLK